MKPVGVVLSILLIAVCAVLAVDDVCFADDVSAVYYVAPAGEMGDGTRQNPWVGVEKIAAGDYSDNEKVAVYLLPGIYRIDSNISFEIDGELDIVGQDGVVFDFSENGGIIISGKVRFSGLSVRADGVDAPLFYISEAHDCVFDNIAFLQTERDVFCFDKGVSDCSVTNCAFSYISGHCIYVEGVNCDKRDEQANKGITISENLFENYGGNVAKEAIKIKYAYNTEISNNEFKNASAGAVYVGAGLGEENCLTYKCKILNNLIHDLYSTDAIAVSALYLDGIQNDSRIYQNVIYNIGKAAEEGIGIQMGKKASYVTVEKNLVFDCSAYGYRIDDGKDNQIKSNVFALNKRGQIYLGESVDLFANGHYQHNIYLSDNAPVYVYMMSFVHFTDYSNVFWDVELKDKVYSCVYDNGDQSMTAATAKRKKLFDSPTVADPLFENVTERDFTLAVNSPCKKTGFVAWDYTAAGRTDGEKYGSGKVWGAEMKASSSGGSKTIYYLIGAVIGVAICGGVTVMLIKRRRSKAKKKDVPVAKPEKSIEEMVNEILEKKRAEEAAKAKPPAPDEPEKGQADDKIESAE